MIEIKGYNPVLPFASCLISAKGVGWYQQQDSNRVILNVRLSHKPKSWTGWLARYHSRPITGMVDTGSWYNIIDKEKFVELGFQVSGDKAGDLGIAGVVQNPSGKNTLWGWREEVRLAPSTLGKGRQPAFKTHLHVTTNGMRDTLIIGLEFLRRYSFILKDELLVLDGPGS